MDLNSGPPRPYWYKDRGSGRGITPTFKFRLTLDRFGGLAYLAALQAKQSHKTTSAWLTGFSTRH